MGNIEGVFEQSIEIVKLNASSLGMANVVLGGKMTEVQFTFFYIHFLKALYVYL